jgi:hypothetical protein
MSLNKKLNAAIAEAEAATVAHGKAALLAEEGAGAAQLNAAAKELQTADKRVSDLQAAVAAAAIRDAQAVADAEAEAARAAQEALNTSVAEVDAIGAEWNAGVDALKAITARYIVAVRAARVNYPPPDLNRRLEASCGTVAQVDEIRWRCAPHL